MDTRYARLGGDHIAYQIIGKGPVDLVFMSAWFSHVDGRWEEPRFAAMLRRLSSFARLILFDKRGSGASDALPTAEPTWEDWADDILAVMDDAGSDKAVVVGVADSGPFAMLFAASHPERTRSLVLVNTGPRFTTDESYPWGMRPEEVEHFLERARDTWGRDATGTIEAFAPSLVGDERYRQWFARYQRMGASPGRSAGMARLLFEIDVRPVLSTIRVPTLVIHRRDFRFFPIEYGRYLAEHIAGAKYVEVAGADGFVYVGDMAAIVDEIQEFAIGTRATEEVDRVLATIVLTDMVGSTDLAVQLGDAHWRQILDAHDDVVRRELERYRGRLHRTTGDGILATFDGPARAIRCTFGIRDALRDLGVKIRAGLHAGEIEVRGDEIGGINVHIAARVMNEAGADRIFASSTVKDLVTGSDITFVDQGLRSLKGVPREWQLYEVG